jgi:hypothetical protein
MARRDAGNVVPGERLVAVLATGMSRPHSAFINEIYRPTKVAGDQATSWATVVEVSSCVRTASAVIGSPNR